MMRRAVGLFIALAALAASVAVRAAPPTNQPPAWDSLTKPQQAVLAPLQRDWASIDSARKQKWLEVARRFPTLPESERQRIQERMGEWARMTPSERGQARLQFQETRQISPEDRHARWEAYQALPDTERQELAKRARGAAKASAPGEPASRSADTSAPKRNVLQPAHQAAVKPVGPTVVQAKPGATTSLMTTKTPPPAHQQPGLPKIAATREFVDPNTMLPQRGPQGAAVRSASSTEPKPAQQ